MIGLQILVWVSRLTVYLAQFIMILFHLPKFNGFYFAELFHVFYANSKIAGCSNYHIVRVDV